MPVRMMTVLKREEDLHEVVPDGLLRDRASGPLRRLNDRRQVTAATKLHEDIQDALVAVDMTVVVAYNVIVVQVFQDVASQDISVCDHNMNHN